MLTKISEEIIKNAVAIEKISNENNDSVKTMYKDFDHMLGGLRRGELYLFAGKGDAGKTSFFVNLINTVGVVQNRTIAYFSMEDGISLSVSKLIKMITKSNTSKQETSEEDALAEKKIYIDDTPGVNIREIDASLSRIENPVDLILVDYLQLMNGYDADSGGANILTGLKEIAKSHNCPVLVAYALKSLDGSIDMNGRYPGLEEIKQGTREIADNIILFLDKEIIFKNDGSGVAVAYFMIVKCREGSNGRVMLMWDPKYLKYSDYKDTGRWHLDRWVRHKLNA